MIRSKSPNGTAGITAWGFRLLLCLALAAPMATAFGQSVMGEMRRQASRSELEKAAKAAESASLSAPDEKTRQQYRVDAMTIRQRLENGDFNIETSEHRCSFEANVAGADDQRLQARLQGRAQARYVVD